MELQCKDEGMEDLNETERKILNRLTRTYNGNLKEFFKGDFVTMLDTMVDGKIGDVLDQSSQNVSVLDKTLQKNDHEARILALEESLNVQLAEKDKIIKNLLEELTEEKRKNNHITEKNNELLAKVETFQSTGSVESQVTNTLTSRVEDLENLGTKLYNEVDNINQYNRKDILQFEEILQKLNENPHEVIIDFLARMLGIYIRKVDISVCHRTVIPSHKKKLGKKYIAPIYCKFVNRSVVHTILSKKHLLRNRRNVCNREFLITENLTPPKKVNVGKSKRGTHRLQLWLDKKW